jgi:hypothetical protein
MTQRSTPVTAEMYLVWSNEHRCWWNPNSSGYTRQVARAGRYSRAEAIEISRGRGWPSTGIPDEVPVLERDAMECFAPDSQP